eukprot:gene24530-10135_t
MGQAQSGDIQDAVNELDQVGDVGKWELKTTNARPAFYDANEDSATSEAKDWHMEDKEEVYDLRFPQTEGYR